MTQDEIIEMANADISYIMSCLQDEFEAITGVQLSENAFDLWSNDMYKRQEKLTELFAKAISKEREACAKVCEDYGRAEEMQAIGNDYAQAIRARDKQ